MRIEDQNRMIEDYDARIADGVSVGTDYLRVDSVSEFLEITGIPGLRNLLGLCGCSSQQKEEEAV